MSPRPLCAIDRLVARLVGGQHSGKSLMLKIDTAKLAQKQAASTLKLNLTNKISKSDKWQSQKADEEFRANVRGELRQGKDRLGRKAGSPSVKLNGMLMAILKPLMAPDARPSFIDFVPPVVNAVGPRYVNALHSRGLEPMDLESMFHKAKRERYRSSAEFRADAKQIETACIAFNEHENGVNSWLLPLARQLLESIERELDRQAQAIADLDAALIQEQAAAMQPVHGRSRGGARRSAGGASRALPGPSAAPDASVGGGAAVAEAGPGVPEAEASEASERQPVSDVEDSSEWEGASEFGDSTADVASEFGDANADDASEFDDDNADDFSEFGDNADAADPAGQGEQEHFQGAAGSAMDDDDDDDDDMEIALASTMQTQP